MMRLINLYFKITFFFLITTLIMGNNFAFTNDSNINSKSLQEKINQNTASLDFSSYFGGSDDDLVYFSEIDSQGNIIFYGYSHSTDFPDTGSLFSEKYKGYLVKFSPQGELIFSTRVGIPSSSNTVHAMSIDTKGNIYLGGETDSPNLYTKNAYNVSFGGKIDGFLMKFSPDGSVEFST